MSLSLGVLAYGEPEYPHGPESVRKEGVPKGEVRRYEWESEIYEGTIREYFVYVPAPYDGEKPAAVMVFQDGHTFVKEDGDLLGAGGFRQPHPRWEDASYRGYHD